MDGSILVEAVCIIQARRQSTRLPDKILLPLGDKPVLQHVIERCQAIEGVHKVVVARPSGEFEKPIDEIAQRSGALSYQGDMDDVLARYWGAYNVARAPYIMRVTADCPLLDPHLCAELLSKMTQDLSQYSGLDGWPHGMECEIFTEELLRQAHEEAHSLPDREHVTLWMKKRKGIKKTFHNPGKRSFRSDNRWVVDYPADYEFLKALFALFKGGAPPISWREILAVVDANPGLRKINRACEEEWNAKTVQIYQEAGQTWTPR